MTLLASLRDWLKAQQLDAVLLSSRQNKQPHLGISTGSGYVVISRESAHILVDSRYYVEVEARAQGYQLHLLDATNTLTTIVNQIIADEQLQTLGFEGQQVSWETAHRWQSELNAKLVSATPDVLRQCDPHLSFFWLEDGHIQACLLLGNCQDGMVENLWTYLSPRARQKQALIYLLGAAVTAAANTLPPDSQVLFSCQTEASDHLVRHLSPSAAPVQSLRVYVRPTLQDQELPEEDAAGREPVTEHEVEEEAMASRELTEEEKKLRAERWNDLQMTPVTEDAPACRNCAHRIAGRLLSCEVYQTKPGPVMYGEACPSFSPVQ